MPVACSAIDITSQLAKWPDTKITGVPASRMAFSFSAPTMVTRRRCAPDAKAARCANSALVRPRFSQTSRMVAEISSSPHSGNAILRLVRARLLIDFSNGPTVRVNRPAMADEASTPITLNTAPRVITAAYSMRWASVIGRLLRGSGSAMAASVRVGSALITTTLSPSGLCGQAHPAGRRK